MNDLVGPGMNLKPNTVEPPQETYFFKRHDGSTISVSEREAWTLLKGNQTVVGKYLPPPQLIGVSDGSKFYQAVQESHQMFAEGKTREEIAARLRLGEKEEYEAALGKIKMPRNFDTIDKNRNPVDIRAL